MPDAGGRTVIDPRMVRLGVAESAETLREVKALLEGLVDAAAELTGGEEIGARLGDLVAVLADADMTLAGVDRMVVCVVDAAREAGTIPADTYTARVDPAGVTEWVDSPNPLERARTAGRIVVSDGTGAEVAVLPYGTVTGWSPSSFDRILFDSGWIRIGLWDERNTCVVEPELGGSGTR